jgi:uncharacterized protein YbjT (DUF2867 family)
MVGLLSIGFVGSGDRLTARDSSAAPMSFASRASQRQTYGESVREPGLWLPYVEVPDVERSKLPAGVEGLVGDLNEPETLTAGLDGVRGMYLLSGYASEAELLAAARRAGVEHVVLQSSSSTPAGDMDNAIARYHILSERAVRDSGMASTFLQPDSFMTNTLQWAPQLRAGDVVREAFPDVRLAMIDPRDIAAVAARVFTSSGHEGRAYRLSGPESLLPADRVAVLAEVLGRDLRFEGKSDAQARAEMSASMPAEYVDALFSFSVDAGSPSAWPSPSRQLRRRFEAAVEYSPRTLAASCACSASSPSPAPMAAISRGSRSRPGMPISLTSRATAPRSAGFRPPRWSPAAPARPASVS